MLQVVSKHDTYMGTEADVPERSANKQPVFLSGSSIRQIEIVRCTEGAEGF
jgi:hypothetical protein